MAAIVSAQDFPPTTPPVSILSTTMSGVLPVIPTATGTPFTGVETIEGAIVYDGPEDPGFTGVLGNALVQNGNPSASYIAVLPSTNFDNATGSLIIGSITGTVPANGTGVMFSVNFAGFPSDATYGPFVYHIHTMPVPANGDCTATLSHLDPTNRGEYYPCINTSPETCQAGDLAGKHGNITTSTFTANYLDLYLSSEPASDYFFGDKSIVIHARNTTRLTCANFTLVGQGANGNGTSSGGSRYASSTGGGYATSTATGTGAGVYYPSVTPSQYEPTSAAGNVEGKSVLGLVAALFGGLVML